MINKKLLSEVLGLNVYGFRTEENTIIVDHENGMPLISNKHINIHELAHKCKEWVHNKGILISSGVSEFGTRFCYLTSGDKQEPPFIADTEPEAIFKACQWILDNEQ